MDDIGTSLPPPRSQHVGDYFRRILEIRVHIHDEIAGTVVEARQHARRDAEISRHVDDADIVVALRRFKEQLQRSIAGIVVDEYQFITRKQALKYFRPENLPQPPDQLGNVFFLVAKGKNDGQGWNEIRIERQAVVQFSPSRPVDDKPATMASTA
jgi:hypothetical protein